MTKCPVMPFLFSAAAIAMLAAYPAFAAGDEGAASGKEIAPAAMETPGKDAAATEKPAPRKQETIALGDSRFFIFSGSTNENYLTGYTVDLIKVDNGVPRFETLLAEDFDLDSNVFSRSEGMAFFASSYHFDKSTGQLDYTTHPHDSDSVYQYKYHLVGNIFKLDEVVTQKPCKKEPCKASEPKVIYKASQHAEAQ